MTAMPAPRAQLPSAPSRAPSPEATTTDRSLLRAVSIAWPTLALALVCLAAWSAALILGAAGVLPLWAAAAVATLAAYAAFTPMHDAAHRAVTKTRWPNEVVGRLMAIPLMGPFGAFRWLHLEHHRHTNDPAVDPDHWSGRGPRWALPLRWLSQVWHYYYLYLRAVRQRPWPEAAEAIGTLVAVFALAGGLAAAGFGTEVLMLWVLPATLASGLLAFAFDFLPHHPHDTLGADDRFKATGVFPSRWLTPLLLSQNYHLVHHLYPAVPFYRYGLIWWSRREELLAKGARVGFGPAA